MSAEHESKLEAQAEPMTAEQRRGVSRRQLLKTAAAAGAGAAAVAALGGLDVVSAAAQGSPAAAATGEEQVFYNNILHEDPTSFDWNLNLYCNAEVETNAGLLTYDANLNPVPDWAEKWEANEDHSVYTFHLRKDNKGWSNGDPVTADDFIYSWTRLLNPDLQGAYASFPYDIKYAQAYNTKTKYSKPGDPLDGKVPTAKDLGLKAIDPWTLQVTLEGPRGNFHYKVAYLAMVPSHKASVEKYGDDWATGKYPLVSNGPLKLDSWDHNVKCVLSKNENYWAAEQMKLTKVVDPVVPAEKTVQNYEHGTGDQQLDWTNVPATDLKRYQSDPALKKELKRYVYPGIWFLIPSNGIKPFDLLEVRRAVSHAVDRQRLVQVVQGLAEVATCMVPIGVFGNMSGDQDLAKIQAFDPKLAMDSLKGTPYEGGKNWPKITMIMRASEEVYNADIMANDIVAQLKANLGMDITIQPIPQSNFNDTLFQNKSQLVFIRWWNDYPDPDNDYGDMFYSRKSSGKRQAWSNAKFDDLVIQGREEADPQKRLAIYKQCEEIIQNDVGYIPLVFRTDEYAFKPWVKGVPVNKQGYTVPDGNIYVRMLIPVSIQGRTAS